MKQMEVTDNRSNGCVSPAVAAAWKKVWEQAGIRATPDLHECTYDTGSQKWHYQRMASHPVPPKSAKSPDELLWDECMSKTFRGLCKRHENTLIDTLRQDLNEANEAGPQAQHYLRNPVENVFA